MVGVREGRMEGGRGKEEEEEGKGRGMEWNIERICSCGCSGATG